MRRIIKNFPLSNKIRLSPNLHNCVEETQRRLLLKNDKIFKEMKLLSPEVAIGGIQEHVFQFKLACQKFNIDISSLTQEWLTIEYNVRA